MAAPINTGPVAVAESFADFDDQSLLATLSEFGDLAPDVIPECCRPEYDRFAGRVSQLSSLLKSDQLDSETVRGQITKLQQSISPVLRSGVPKQALLEAFDGLQRDLVQHLPDPTFRPLLNQVRQTVELNATLHQLQEQVQSGRAPTPDLHHQLLITSEQLHHIGVTNLDDATRMHVQELQSSILQHSTNPDLGKAVSNWLPHQVASPMSENLIGPEDFDNKALLSALETKSRPIAHPEVTPECCQDPYSKAQASVSNLQRLLERREITPEFAAQRLSAIADINKEVLASPAGKDFSGRLNNAADLIKVSGLNPESPPAARLSAVLAEARARTAANDRQELHRMPEPNPAPMRPSDRFQQPPPVQRSNPEMTRTEVKQPFRRSNLEREALLTKPSEHPTSRITVEPTRPHRTASERTVDPRLRESDARLMQIDRKTPEPAPRAQLGEKEPARSLRGIPPERTADPRLRETEVRLVQITRKALDSVTKQPPAEITSRIPIDRRDPVAVIAPPRSPFVRELSSELALLRSRKLSTSPEIKNLLRQIDQQPLSTNVLRRTVALGIAELRKDPASPLQAALNTLVDHASARLLERHTSRLLAAAIKPEAYSTRQLNRLVAVLARDLQPIAARPLPERSRQLLLRALAMLEQRAMKAGARTGESQKQLQSLIRQLRITLKDTATLRAGPSTRFGLETAQRLMRQPSPRLIQELRSTIRLVALIRDLRVTLRLQEAQLLKHPARLSPQDRSQLRAQERVLALRITALQRRLESGRYALALRAQRRFPPTAPRGELPQPRAESLRVKPDRLSHRTAQHTQAPSSRLVVQISDARNQLREILLALRPTHTDRFGSVISREQFRTKLQHIVEQLRRASPALRYSQFARIRLLSLMQSLREHDAVLSAAAIKDSIELLSEELAEQRDWLAQRRFQLRRGRRIGTRDRLRARRHRSQRPGTTQRDADQKSRNKPKPTAPELVGSATRLSVNARTGKTITASQAQPSKSLDVVQSKEDDDTPNEYLQEMMAEEAPQNQTGSASTKLRR